MSIERNEGAGAFAARDMVAVVANNERTMLGASLPRDEHHIWKVVMSPRRPEQVRTHVSG